MFIFNLAFDLLVDFKCAGNMGMHGKIGCAV